MTGLVRHTIHDPAAHDDDCDWHLDQYPFECSCGVYIASKGLDPAGMTQQQIYEATRRAWAEAIGRPYPEKESQRPES